MSKNVALDGAIAHLRRRCHNLVTELEHAAETLEGDALVNAVQAIGIDYGLEDIY